MERLKRIFTLNEHDKYLLNQAPFLLIVGRSIYEFISFCFCLSFAISHIIEGPWWKYFTFFSYWTLSFTIFTFFIAFITSILEILRFLYKKQKNLKLEQIKKVQTALDVFTFLRNRLFILTFIEVIFVTGAFWIFLPENQNYKYYSTIGAHIVSICLVFIEYLLIVLYLIWWDLLIVLGISLCYYLFTVYIYYQRNIWVYYVQDPKTNSTWYLIIVIGFFVFIALYLIIRFLNSIKNKLYVIFSWKFNKDQGLVFKRVPEIDYRTYVRNQCLIILSILYATACFSVYVNISILVASKVQTTLLGNFAYEIIYLVFETFNVAIGFRGVLLEKYTSCIRVMNWVIKINFNTSFSF